MARLSLLKSTFIMGLFLGVSGISQGVSAEGDSAEALTLSSCSMQPHARWSIEGTNLEVGDAVTLSVGGFDVTYIVNKHAIASDTWPMYLAMKFNAEVPASFARMGDAKKEYQPVVKKPQANAIDVFARDVPISLSINRMGKDVKYSGLSKSSLPPITYSNEMLIPNIHLSGGRALNLYFQNRTNEDIKVRAWMFDPKGNPDKHKTYFNYPFSEDNNPMNSFATLYAKATSRLAFGRDKSRNILEASIRVMWVSNSCLETPLLITAESVWAYDGEPNAEGQMIGAANGITRQDYGPF